jgi:hypothetical protein
MSLFVVSRRKIVYDQPAMGSSLVVFVPGADQVQIMKDGAGTIAPVSGPKGAASASNRGPQLLRVQKGQRTVYGHLPVELRERRERLKVWLAEDLAPPEAEAFFYIFSPSVVVHGVRERTDEGKLAWRTAQLLIPPEADFQELLRTSLADYTLGNAGQHVCLAVANDFKLFKAVQQIGAANGMTAVPFSTLKPAPELSPLYGHLNFTWVYMLVMLLGALGVVGMATLFLFKQTETRQVETQIAATDAQIAAVQINPRTGHIRQPEAALAELGSGLKAPPSALLAQAGMAGKNFGNVRAIRLTAADQAGNPETGMMGGEGLHVLQVDVQDPRDVLLVDQAARANEFLRSQPWVRQLLRTGAAGNQMMLMVVLQASNTGIVVPQYQPATVSESITP